MGPTCKVYNLPNFNHHIDKSLKYNLDGNYLAITIPSESEFIECTYVSGHFCSLRNALYHTHNSGWCLTALFLKNDNMIDVHCKIYVTNVNGSGAIYLDQGNWAVVTMEPDQMEISCNSHRHVISVEPPLTLVNLQHAFSTFSARLKLSPNFKQYSKGYDIAIKTANLHSITFSLIDFCIWKSFNASSLFSIQKSNLMKLDTILSVPVNELRAMTDSVKMLHFDSKDKSQFYYLGDIQSLVYYQF